MIDMPHVVSAGVVKQRSGNYSNCPLKKRPIKYDLADESDSDLSHNGSSPAPMEISEPENLSTKPEDLRLATKPGAPTAGTGAAAALTSPPPIGLVAGRGDLSPISPTYMYGPTPPYSPGSFPEPPLLKFMSSSGGPLEPISLNPPAVWPRVSPFSASSSAFSYPGGRHQHQQHHYSRHSDMYHHQGMNFSPKGSSGPGPAVIRTQPQPYNSPAPHYVLPFANSNSRSEPGSPPHVSPPLKTEPSYPVIKQEIISRMHGHLDNVSRLVDIHNDHHSHSRAPQIKREVLLGHSHGHHYPTSLSRESVISHSHSHSHGHSHGHGSCSSGVSSPTSSTSSSRSSNGSITGIPPMTTPTNGGSVRYQCSDCSKSYSTYSGLTKHVQFHCSSQNKKSFICKFCEKVYVSLGALKMHIRTHTLPCKCLHCGKAFSRPWLLQGHIRTHTGEKPFACQHCNRAFADRSNLRAHLQTHSEVKKYSCKACSKTFSRMSLLVKHEDSGCASTLSN